MPPKAKEAKGAAGKDAKGKDAKGKDAKAAGGKDAKDAGGKGPRGPRGAADAKARGRGRGDKKEDERGGFGRGFGGRRGRGRGRRARGAQEKEEWTPLTKLGRLVQAKKIRSLEEIYLFSLPIKEYQIVDHFIPSPDLKDEVMAIAPVQKQSAAGQRTRFRAFVIVGDENGHIGLGNKVAKEVATAIRGAIIDAKLHVIPVRRGYWGGRLGAPHTVPCKVQGKSGSVRFRIIPAPKGTGLVAAKVPKKVLTYAGIKDCYTSSTGQSKTLGNFVKATIGALEQTYGYLTPDLWATTVFEKSPYQEHTDFLKEYVPPPPKKKAVSSAS